MIGRTILIVLTVAALLCAAGCGESGPKGGVKLSDQDTEVILAKGRREYVVSGAGAEMQLTAGTYSVKKIRIVRRVKETEGSRTGENAWVLACDRPGGKIGNVAVRPESTTTVTCGQPLTVRATVGGPDKSGSVFIGCSIVGQGGEEYGPAVYKNGKMMAAPSFIISDESGKELAKGSFAYG